MANKHYLIDLDGTMYKGKQNIDGAIDFINYLLQNNIDFIFLTNNATRTQKQAKQHMLNLGFKGIKEKHFYTSAMAASDYIKDKYPNKNKAYFIGEEGMKEALSNNGFIITADNPDFLFVGLDRNACYEDYSYALRVLVNGARLVGTNNDRILLSEKGANIGNGSVVKLFEYASNQEAIKIGKPHLPIIDGALKYMNISKNDAIIIGDNLETDIQLGINADIDTILVTTGVHTYDDCLRLNIKPTYIVDNLKNLISK